MRCAHTEVRLCIVQLSCVCLWTNGKKTTNKEGTMLVYNVYVNILSHVKTERTYRSSVPGSDSNGPSGNQRNCVRCAQKKKNTRRHQARKTKPRANSWKDQVQLKETLALLTLDDVSDDTGEDSKRRCATTEPVHQAGFGKNSEKEMSFF